MKKIYFTLLLLLLTPFAMTRGNNQGQNTTGKPVKIQVYYFHYERRCATCIAVEDETKKALSELYATQMKKGEITFQSVNLEEKSGEALADKLKVAGQSLVIVNGANVVDITEKAFMYAKSEPSKLKAEIKKQVDQQIK